MNGLGSQDADREYKDELTNGVDDSSERLNNAYDLIRSNESLLDSRDQALRHTEAELAEIKQRYQVMVEAIPDGILRIDRDHNVEYLNPSGQQLYTMIQESQGEPGAPAMLTSISETLRNRVFLTGQEAMLEYTIPAQDGNRFIRARYLPEFDTDRQVKSILVIFRDVTGRRRVEESLRSTMMENQRQRELLETISDANPGGLAVLVGERLVHQFANPAYRALTPYPDIDPIGRSYVEIWPPTQELRGTWLIQRAVETGKPVHLDWYAQPFPDGSIRYFSLDIRRIPWKDQPAVLLVLWDTTAIEDAYRRAEVAALEAKSAAEEARIRAEEAEERQRELEILAQALERSNKDLQDFAFIASHDLKEPLRKIQAFGELLKSGYNQNLGEKGSDYVLRMQDASQRMQWMIDDLLSYSRIATKAEPFVQVDLNRVARDVLADLEMQIRDVGGKVEIAELPNVEADPVQMRQLFQNLIGNALKFHRPGTPPLVNVSARRVSLPAFPYRSKGDKVRDAIELSFEDNGIGFDEKFLDRIFQPFQRLHGRSEYEGSGIGLAISRKIALRHRGSITAHSQPGQGSVFVVTLPISQWDES